jgi:hypothetical protein
VKNRPLKSFRKSRLEKNRGKSYRKSESGETSIDIVNLMQNNLIRYVKNLDWNTSIYFATFVDILWAAVPFVSWLSSLRKALKAWVHIPAE